MSNITKMTLSSELIMSMLKIPDGVEIRGVEYNLMLTIVNAEPQCGNVVFYMESPGLPVNTPGMDIRTEVVPLLTRVDGESQFQGWEIH